LELLLIVTKRSRITAEELQKMANGVFERAKVGIPIRQKLYKVVTEGSAEATSSKTTYNYRVSIPQSLISCSLETDHS
jgi:hypothetical protein